MDVFDCRSFGPEIIPIIYRYFSVVHVEKDEQKYRLFLVKVVIASAKSFIFSPNEVLFLVFLG